MLLMFKGPQILAFWSICLKISFLHKGDSEPVTLPIIDSNILYLFIITWFSPLYGGKIKDSPKDLGDLNYILFFPRGTKGYHLFY